MPLFCTELAEGKIIISLRVDSWVSYDGFLGSELGFERFLVVCSPGSPEISEGHSKLKQQPKQKT